MAVNPQTTTEQTRLSLITQGEARTKLTANDNIRFRNLIIINSFIIRAQ